MPSDAFVAYGEDLDDARLVQQFWRDLKASEDHFLEKWEAAGVGHKVYGVNGRKAADKQFMQDLRKISVELPFCAGIVDTIRGADMAQGVEPQFRAQDEGPADAALSDLMTRVVRHVRGKSTGHRKESEAYFDMLIGGYGFAEAFMDMTQVPVRPVEAYVPFWEVFPDPDAIEPNLVDARFFVRVRDWPLEQVQARWPEKKEDIDRGVKTGVVMRTAPTAKRPVRSVENRLVRGQVPGTTPQGTADKVTVYEYLHQRLEPRVIYYDPETGERVDAPFEEYRARKKEIDRLARDLIDDYAERLTQGLMEPPPEVPELGDVHNYAGPTWYRAFLLGNADAGEGMLLERRPLSIKEPTLKCVTGYEEKDPESGRVTFFGIMKKILGIEYWMTKGFETYLETMARGSKGGATAEKGVLPPGMTEKQFAEQFNLPGNLKWVADGAVQEGRFQYDPVQPEPTSFWRLVEVCQQLMGFLTGVTPALQGTLEAAPRTSNVFVSNLQESGLQMLLPIREPKTAFVVAMGKLLAALVVHHLPAAEIDKILGKVEIEGLTHMKQMDPMTGAEQLVPIPSDEIDPETGMPLPVTAGMLLKDPRVLEYDVTVDVGAATPSQKQDAWRWFSTGLGETFRDWGVPPEIIVPVLVRNAPLPGTMTEKMADDLEAHYEQQKLAGTAEGMLKGFAEMMQADPRMATQIHSQIMQMAQAAPQNGAIA